MQCVQVGVRESLHGVPVLCGWCEDGLAAPNDGNRNRHMCINWTLIKRGGYHAQTVQLQWPLRMAYAKVLKQKAVHQGELEAIAPLSGPVLYTMDIVLSCCFVCCEGHGEQVLGRFNAFQPSLVPWRRSNRLRHIPKVGRKQHMLHHLRWLGLW